METMQNAVGKERLALFAFSFVILAVGGPCGFLDKYLTVGNTTITPLGNQTVATHLACESGACVPVSGSGTNECGTDSDCTTTAPPAIPVAPTTTHLECVSNKCVAKDGAGADTCSSAGSDCGAATAPSCTGYKSCGSCVAASGCGWCNYTGICSAGTSTAPTIGSCQAQWFTTQAQCNPPATVTPPPAATGCSQYTDCSSCLKTSPGTCKWCIQGSVCAEASDTSSCFGGLGWLTKDYQCNLASR